MAGDLINVVFYMAVFSFATLFSLMSWTSRAGQAEAWRGPVFGIFAFVFWSVMAQVHVYVAANFEATDLISLSYLWYVLGIFFLVLSFVMVWQWYDLKQKSRWSTV